MHALPASSYVIIAMGVDLSVVGGVEAWARSDVIHVAEMDVLGVMTLKVPAMRNVAVTVVVTAVVGRTNKV